MHNAIGYAYVVHTHPTVVNALMCAQDAQAKVRDKAPNAVTVLIGSDGNKTMMAVGVSKNALARGLKAGALVKKIAAIAGGNGGGKPDFAMAGIRDTSKIDDALNAVPEIVKAEMNQ